MRPSRALLIAIAGVFGATTVRASEAPAVVARAIYTSYAGGDARGFQQLWAEGVAPARLNDLKGEQRLKCISVVAFSAEEPQAGKDGVDVPVVAVLSRTSRVNGRTTIDAEHTTVSLKREHDEWRVAQWTFREDELADRVAAAKSADEARALVRENADLLDFSFYRALRRLSTVLINQRKFDACERLTAGLREFAALTADEGAVSTAYSLDSIVERIGPKPDLARAVISAQEGVALAERFNDPDVLASALLNLARCFQFRDGNSTNGAPLFARVIGARDRLDDQGLVVRAAILMAGVHEEHGDYRACFPYLQMAEEIATRLSNPSSLYEVEMHLGDVYAAENDFDLAVIHLIRAREYAEKTGSVAFILAVEQMLSRCYVRQGKTKEFRAVAADVLKRAAGPMLTYSAMVLTDSARADLQRADLVLAAAHAEEAVTDAEKTAEDDALADALETKARVLLARKRYDETIRTAERAIAIREKEQTVARFTPWFLTAQAHLALGNRPAAYTALRTAVDYGELERAGLAGSERQLELSFEPDVAAYVMLVGLLVEDHRYEEAFLVAEKAKARALLDVLASERSSAEHDMLASEIAEEKRLEQTLVQANRKAASPSAAGSGEVRQARLELESYRAVLDARYPRLHAARGAGQLTSLGALAPILSHGSNVLVEYVVGPHRVYIFIVRTVSPRLRVMVRTVAIEQPELDRLINRYAVQLASRDAAYKHAARRLYDVLLAPVIGAIGDEILLSIVPDGSLWHIPFETLVDGNGRFAVESRALHYAPSAAVLLRGQMHLRTGALKGRRVFLGFANPRVAEAGYRPIPEAEQEVRAISRFFGAGGSKVYLGADALESRSKEQSPDYAIVHFATHGVMDDANPMYSRLLLARRAGDQEDGSLEAREMMKLHLSADLVVLSACDTARGDVHAGEGLIGMTWALFAAGTPSVIASEWRAGSATTAGLMENFYGRWIKSRAAGHPYAKAEALRDARLTLLHDSRYRHPYYWAPFVLVGSAD